MRISDWRSDVCSSDLGRVGLPWRPGTATAGRYRDDRRTRPALVLPFPAEPRGAAPGPDTDAAAAPGVVELELSVRTAPRPADTGRASWRKRVCPYVYVSVGCCTLNKQTTHNNE